MRIRRTLLCAVVILGLNLAPSRGYAQESSVEPPVSFQEDGAAIPWGLTTLTLSLIGTGLVVTAAEDTLEDNLALTIGLDVVLAIGVIGLPFLNGHLASEGAWPVEAPVAVSTALVGWAGGFMVGCALERRPIPSSSTWDLGAIPSCGDATTWMISGLAGLVAGAYPILRGETLFQRPGSSASGSTMVSSPYAASMLSFLTFLIANTSAAISGQLENGGKPFVGENQLFPSGRGNVMTLGLLQLGYLGGMFALAEILAP